jgi:uncharacterized protein (DUF2147 family)
MPRLDLHRFGSRLMRPAVVVFALSAGAVLTPPAAAQDRSPGATSSEGAGLETPVGLWSTPEGRSHVRIYPCEGSKLCGRIAWLREPNWTDGTPLVDKRNPDPKLRDRPVLGLLVLWGFSRGERDGRWDGGGMYHPEEGEYYRGALNVRPDGTLRVRGYRKVPIVGKTQIWTRVRAPAGN